MCTTKIFEKLSLLFGNFFSAQRTILYIHTRKKSFSELNFAIFNFPLNPFLATYNQNFWEIIITFSHFFSAEGSIVYNYTRKVFFWTEQEYTRYLTFVVSKYYLYLNDDFSLKPFGHGRFLDPYFKVLWEGVKLNFLIFFS